MWPLSEFEAKAGVEVGTDLAALIPAGAVESWVNEGRTRIEYLDYKTGDITWAALDTEVDLPVDLITFSKLKPTSATVVMPPWEKWGNKLVFTDPDGAVAAGTARVYYRAYFPTITDAVDSALPEEADRGLLSYVLYRFYRLLVSSRAVYNRYATLVGRNAVQLEDLQDEATRHYDDFLASQDTLPAEEPAFHWQR